MPSAGSRRVAHTVAPLAVVVLCAVVSWGCESSVTFEDGDDPARCGPSCDAGADEVRDCPAGAICYEKSLCDVTILCAEVEDQCGAYPICNPGDEEVPLCPDDGSCYEAEACGSVITCHELAACDGYPSCDPDDATVQGCPLDASCYEASLCGSTILCLDEGLAHGCPEVQPTDGEPCDYDEQYGVVCDYLEPDGCLSTLTCQVTGEDKPPEWVFIGGGCLGGS